MTISLTVVTTSPGHCLLVTVVCNLRLPISLKAAALPGLVKGHPKLAGQFLNTTGPWPR